MRLITVITTASPSIFSAFCGFWWFWFEECVSVDYFISEVIIILVLLCSCVMTLRLWFSQVCEWYAQPCDFKSWNYMWLLSCILDLLKSNQALAQPCYKLSFIKNGSSYIFYAYIKPNWWSFAWGNQEVFRLCTSGCFGCRYTYHHIWFSGEPDDHHCSDQDQSAAYWSKYLHHQPGCVWPNVYHYRYTNNCNIYLE